MTTYRLYQEGEREFVLKDDQGNPAVLGASPMEVLEEIIQMTRGLNLPVIDAQKPKKAQSQK